MDHVNVDLRGLDEAACQAPGNEPLRIAGNKPCDPHPADKRQGHGTVLIHREFAAELVLLEDNDAQMVSGPEWPGRARDRYRRQRDRAAGDTAERQNHKQTDGVVRSAVTPPEPRGEAHCTHQETPIHRLGPL